jgi:hypothetical protein
MARIRPLIANDDGWTEWQMPARHYRMGCCDCGLVHNVEFRVIVVGRRTKKGGYRVKRMNPAGCRVEFRVSRNNRSTGQERRHRSKTA